MPSRALVPVGLLLAAFVAGAVPDPASAQTAVPQPPAPASDQPPPVPTKSKRLDKHAAPWTVIWNSRLWTDVPETQDFVKATHPDPKTLDYAPLIGKDPSRPTPRDAKGVEALRAELEADIQRNEARGKAVTPVAPMTAEPAKPANPPKAAGGRRAKRSKASAKSASAKSASAKSASAKPASAKSASAKATPARAE